MILLRDQLFPLYLLSESGISESVVAYGSMEAIVETLEAMEEKLRGQDDSWEKAVCPKNHPQHERYKRAGKAQKCYGSSQYKVAAKKLSDK